MSDPIINEILNNRRPLLNFVFFSGVGLLVNHWTSLTSMNGFFAAATMACLFGPHLATQFWGKKFLKIKFKNGQSEGETEEKIECVESSLSKSIGLKYPYKTELGDLERHLREQLEQKLQPAQEDRTRRAIHQRIETITHHVAKTAVEKYPELFYLADQRRVKEASYVNKARDGEVLLQRAKFNP